ncbi:D-alanyl-lipoteichoic acid biosynthesis protein DltB [Peptostreptococcaceae bacterium OttesenSCG-928-C18]|nr:D-alanyl-lipoteichoic acid biosynthesis protein DltB [Peptostreptococcaceae bacterium OttesenSCG-928-C18]
MFSQYSDFFSLYIYFLLLLPAIILGLLGKKIKYYGFIVSIPALLMIFLQSATLSWDLKNYYKLIQFIIFIAFELTLTMFFKNHWAKYKNKIVYYIVLILSIAPLFLIKISPYFNWNHLGFIGISYISFRVWQIIIDTKDNNFKHSSLIDVIYFITFFPTLSSGPIDRQKRFFKEVNSKIEPKSYLNDYFLEGLKKIFLGIAYKFAIATLINQYIIEKLPEGFSISNMLIYMYAYTLYLFFDFAGYSNFAIGTSYFLGVKAPDNFNKPFLARNMKEFWNRWHMSLSKWFQDYIFSRFMLNSLRSGKLKNMKIAVRVSYMVTMLTMGVWHGFNIYYLLYGLYQGILLVLTDIYLSSSVYNKFKKTKLYTPLSIIINFQFISFGMLLFSGYLFK